MKLCDNNCACGCRLQNTQDERAKEAAARFADNMFDDFETLEEHFLRPRNVGKFADAANVYTGATGSPQCGAILRLAVRIDADAQIIIGARFLAVGCRYLVAAASLLTEALHRMPIGDAARLTEAANTACSRAVPADRIDCVLLCAEALRACLADWQRAAPSCAEWNGDEALVCTCFGVSERAIEQAIQAHALSSVREVTRACRAGGGCGSCHPLIEDMLENYWHTLLAQNSLEALE